MARAVNEGSRTSMEELVLERPDATHRECYGLGLEKAGRRKKDCDV
jgi:hypothetical protein